MTYQVAKDAVDWLIENKRWKNKHGKPNEKVSITYFGGEPTLMWDEIIVPLTRYAFETYPNEVNFGMTTNGTLLNEQRIKFMVAYQINPLLSIDGAPRTQDYNRPCHDGSSSFDLIKDNIPILLKYFPNTTFRSTIDENTVQYTFENYIFAQYMGFKNIYMMPNGRTEWKQENLEILKSEFERIYDYIISFFEKGQMPPINFSCINDSFKRLKEIVQNDIPKRNCIRCGLGTGMGSIGYDGSIYGCQEQNSHEQDSYFYLGNIYNNGINKEKHFKFLQDYLNIKRVICGEHPEYCITCPLESICGSMNCPSSSYDLFKTFGKDSYVHCYWFRLMHELANQTCIKLNDNKIFREYLSKNCNYKFKKEE